jgi:hypothetical protein
MRYASQTEVSSEKSQTEIRSTLNRYGATKFMFYEEDMRAAIAFEISSRRIRFVIPLPDRKADEFIYQQINQSGARRVCDVVAQHKKWEQACRQKWRALALAIKAKLEAVESGIATFEEEFLAYVVLPDNRTVGEFLAPQLDAVYASGVMPKMLPALGETGAAS